MFILSLFYSAFKHNTALALLLYILASLIFPVIIAIDLVMLGITWFITWLILKPVKEKPNNEHTD